MLLRQLFDPDTSTYSYLLADPDTREAVLIDPVHEQVDHYVQVLEELGLTLTHTLETHVHADHVTGARALADRLGSRTVVGVRTGVSCADVYAKQGDRVAFGRFTLEARETPGHTDGCVTWVTGDRAAAFTGDTLLIGGCGRTDFQQGDPHTLYRSVHEQIFTLPDETTIYPGHDYKGRTHSTVGAEKQDNARLGGGRSEPEFVAIMEALDLAYPRRIDFAVPANQQCGRPVLESERTAEGVPEVGPEPVAAGIPGARLVDVRRAEEFEGPLGRVPGSELVPLDTLTEAAESWDRHAPFVLICRSGGRSGAAARRLEAMGFTQVASLVGGMLRWNELALPTERAGEVDA